MPLMTSRRKIIGLITITILAFVFWAGYGAFRSWRLLPEAYAAWDTGTLLVEYLKANDDRWPSSWDELLTVMDAPGAADIVLYGSKAGDLEYARSLREMVSVDWSFDSSEIDDANPVTRPDGTGFPVFWEGADPNEMVRDYFKSQ